MIMRVAWRRDGDTKPQMLVVATAWPVGDWVAYRKPGEPRTTHYIPSSAVWEIIVEEQDTDPDPMRRAP